VEGVEGTRWRWERARPPRCGSTPPPSQVTNCKAADRSPPKASKNSRTTALVRSLAAHTTRPLKWSDQRVSDPRNRQLSPFSVGESGRSSAPEPPGCSMSTMRFSC
jgi:hypothetical protein